MAVSYRGNAGRYGLSEPPEETEHLTQRTWTRVGAIYTFSSTQQASAFLNAGIAEDSDRLPRSVWAVGSACAPNFP